ncbi:DUF927 domain-containing protein [Enterobacter sp. JUb54]|uniref:DUF927 domain-containing protein n=1 Tax=Enterobacter sp. JUb54 TaxID=2724468 RepID=UPI00164E894F|nr:DUF927 domain-containing protein [Enterobacter sp. JUb54]QNK06852.1 DUF927 domain-containing protein [Enterobacter sp. JUb54]
MKNAPNLKNLPKDKFTEAIIFAGADAWVHAKAWQENNPAHDTVPPVTLGTSQLTELDNLRIIDHGRRYARVYRAGELEQETITAIATQLAIAGVQEARFYSESYELLENWTAQLPRLKAAAEEKQSAVPANKATRKPHDTHGDALRSHVESRADGVFWVEPKQDRDSGEVINRESWLCSPLDVTGIGTDGTERFLILRWLAQGASTETTQAIPLADIGEREGWRKLKAGGVNVTTRTGLRATLADWLQRSGNGEVWQVSHATGWQHGAYIMPDGEIIGTPAAPVLFNGRSSAAAGYTLKGTAEGWRESVGRLAAGNYSMMTGIAAALAAPLIGLVEADGFGLHFYEQSSAGKTTTANVAASLYGNPDLLRLTWYGTALGLANEAAAHNDALMPLDEIGQGADPVEVYKSAYALFNGTGKLQGAKEGGNRELKRWRTVAVSTGEVDLETFIAGAGRKAKAGQLVRLLNIPLSKAIHFQEYQNGKQHADALKDAWQHQHGAAGREWVKWLADHQQEAKDAVRAAEARWRSLIPADYGEQVHRVGARFAILEAALVLGEVITGWDTQTSRDAIQHSFNAWVREFGTGNKEHQQIIEQCEAFLNAYGMSRFAPLDYDPRDLPIHELYGYRDKGGESDEPVLFYVLPAPFRDQLAKGFNKDTAARILSEAGMLKKSSSVKGWQIRMPRLRHLNNARPWAYALFFAPEAEPEPEQKLTREA